MFAEIEQLNLDATRRGRVNLLRAGQLQTRIVTQCVLSFQDRIRRGEALDSAIQAELASRWEIIARAGATIPTLRDSIRGALESMAGMMAQPESRGSSIRADRDTEEEVATEESRRADPTAKSGAQSRAEWLAQALKTRGWSPEYAAQMGNGSPSGKTVRKIMKGEKVSNATLSSLAKALSNYVDSRGNYHKVDVADIPD